jgi:hypothetical protein
VAVQRLLVLLAILVVGAAAPARAWCEATCIAPTANTEPHCPSHDEPAQTTSIAASTAEQCPVLESARPTAPARLALHSSSVAHYLPDFTTPIRIAASFDRSRHATVFERCTPLRI